jgi:NAD(P)-dependent dehydrogenase (short-subunit alcohol dehydrogenase family)
VASRLLGLGERPHLAVQMDVTDRSSVEQAQVAASEPGQIDTLVNVAGGDIEHGTADTEDEVWVCSASISSARPLLPLGDSLPSANTMSPAIVPSPVNAFTCSAVRRTLGEGWAHVTDGQSRRQPRSRRYPGERWAPGTIRTRVWDSLRADRLQPCIRRARRRARGRRACAIAFLASSDAAWITGHILPVDGGLLIGDSSRLDAVTDRSLAWA